MKNSLNTNIYKSEYIKKFPILNLKNTEKFLKKKNTQKIINNYYKAKNIHLHGGFLCFIFGFILTWFSFSYLNVGNNITIGILLSATVISFCVFFSFYIINIPLVYQLIHHIDFGYKKNKAKFNHNSLFIINSDGTPIFTHEMIENNILTMNGEMNGVKFIGGEYRGFDEYSGSGGEDSLGGYLFKFTYEKNIANSKYPVLLNPFSFDIEDKKKYKEVHFSNVDFSSKFKVYSQDEIDAKKILKPKFMYQLYDYVTCFNTTYYYRFYIYKNEINIIFTFPPYQGDSGELNSNRELDTFFQKYQEISHVLNFIKQVKF